MPSFIDLTGQTFGDLTVIERAEDYMSPKGKRVTQWLCYCKCGRYVVKKYVGLAGGHSRSCGQCRKDNFARMNGIDMLNQKFGRLTVIAKSDRKASNGQYYWTCQCECGNIKDIRGDALREGKTLSCGCYCSDRARETAESCIKDLSGQRFGKLVAIEYVGKNAANQYKWLCKCDCGNELVILGTNLVQGYTKSCGCVNSHGELYTRIILTNHNIKFVQQKTFDNLVGLRDGLLSYDFFLPDYNVLIEYQGRQHYEPIQCFGGEEQFKVQQEHDKRKREYAYNHGIRLIEIPYTIDTQEDIELFLQEELAMAVRPMINTIKADIKNVSIYLRSTKKFGKTTLFRDVILEKYGDPSRGLLIGLGSEVGYTMLDNINAVQVNNYADLSELIDWLITTKGKEHNIEIVAFDTVDELVLITDVETIRIHNKENPTKKVKSIKAALGGFTAGEKYSANDIIKPLLNKVRNAGFGVWCLSHTKFKNIKTKGTTDTEGYMQLTSNLGADYESAFGDCLDVVLTGVVDKEIENKEVNGETKRFSTGTTRKLYFRETELIDAGGRFAFGTVPEYLEFNKPNMAADFIRIVEEGMEKSKTVKDNVKSSAPKSTAKPKKEEVIPDEPVDEPEEEPADEIVEEEPVEETDDIFEEEPTELTAEDKIAAIKDKITDNTDLKKSVVAILKENGIKAFNASMDEDVLDEIYALI